MTLQFHVDSIFRRIIKQQIGSSSIQDTQEVMENNKASCKTERKGVSVLQFDSDFETTCYLQEELVPVHPADAAFPFQHWEAHCPGPAVDAT